MKRIAIETKVKSEFENARKYYAILFEVNNIKLTDSELDLVTYCAINGTFSTPPVRDEFIKEFKVHKNTVYNILARLQKIGILVKDKDKKVRVNPRLALDFKADIFLQIKIKYDEKGNIRETT